MKKIYTFLVSFIYVSIVNAQMIPIPTFVVRYPLSQASGSNDISGNNRSLTALEVSTYSPNLSGQIDSAAVLSSTTTGGVHTFTDVASYQLQNFTISAWIKPETKASGYGNIFELGFSHFLRLNHISATDYRLEYGFRYSNTGFVTKNVTMFNNLFNNTWHHVAYVHKNLGDVQAGASSEVEMKLYVDGKLFDTHIVVDIGDVFYDVTSNIIQIGKRQGSSTMNFMGGMFDVAYSNQALTEQQINLIYNAANPPADITIQQNTPNEEIKLCQNKSRVFQISATNVLSYHWLNNGGVMVENFAQVGTNTSTFTLANMLSDYVLQCYLIGNGTHATTNITTVTMVPNLGALPSISRTNDKLWINQVNNATNYEWYKNGTLISSGNKDTALVITENGDYTLKILNTGCSITTTVYNVNTFVVTSIDDKKDIRVIVYPNPANEKITIEFFDEFAKIEVFDITGKFVLDKALTKNNNDLQLSEISEGVYFVNVIQNSGTQRFKFIVSR